MATQTSARTTDLLTGVEFTFTPADATASNQAATGTVNVSSSDADAKGAVNAALVYGALANGVQKATLILTAAQVTTLGTSTKMNLLVEVFHSDGTVLQFGSAVDTDGATLIVTANVAPAFTITSVLGRDNKFVITATHTNPNEYTVLDETAAAFRMMYSRGGVNAAAGYVLLDTNLSDGGVSKSAGTGANGNDVYTLTTLADATQLPNNIENDIWVQGRSTAAFGAYRTNLAGVLGIEATPNNLPAQPADLVIDTNINGTIFIFLEKGKEYFTTHYSDDIYYGNHNYIFNH